MSKLISARARAILRAEEKEGEIKELKRTMARLEIENNILTHTVDALAQKIVQMEQENTLRESFSI